MLVKNDSSNVPKLRCPGCDDMSRVSKAKFIALEDCRSVAVEQMERSLP